jgi:hypothetical protein
VQALKQSGKETANDPREDDQPSKSAKGNGAMKAIFGSQTRDN